MEAVINKFWISQNNMNQNSVETVSLIKTSLTTKGSGENADSPIRIITQYWTTDGTLVFEIDPAAVPLTLEMQARIRNAVYKDGESLEARKTYELIMDAIHADKK